MKDTYFISKEKNGEFVARITPERIIERFEEGSLSGDYMATAVQGLSYGQVIEQENAHWSRVDTLADALKKELPPAVTGSHSARRQIDEKLVGAGKFIRVFGVLLSAAAFTYFAFLIFYYGFRQLEIYLFLGEKAALYLFTALLSYFGGTLLIGLGHLLKTRLNAPGTDALLSDGDGQVKSIGAGDVIQDRD